MSRYDSLSDSGRFTLPSYNQLRKSQDLSKNSSSYFPFSSPLSWRSSNREASNNNEKRNGIIAERRGLAGLSLFRGMVKSNKDILNQSSYLQKPSVSASVKNDSSNSGKDCSMQVSLGIKPQQNTNASALSTNSANSSKGSLNSLSLTDYQTILTRRGIDLITHPSPSVMIQSTSTPSPAGHVSSYYQELMKYKQLEEAKAKELLSVHDRVSLMMSKEASNLDTSAMDEDDDADSDAQLRIKTLLEARHQKLSSAEESYAVSIINGPQIDEVIIDKFAIDMTRNKLSCLRPGAWLNDEVINFYMSMLEERDLQLSQKKPTRLTSHFFNSFFVTKLLEHDRYNYTFVKRWTKKFDIQSKDKIFCPININNTHWTIAVVFIQKKEIHYYDSMSSSGAKYLKGLLQWVKDDVLDKKQINMDMSEWKTFDKESYVPKQKNGFDCGMFIITCADFLSDDLPLNYSQQHMQEYRIKYAASIIRGSLNYPLI